MIDTEKRYRAVVHYEYFLRSIRKVAKIYGVSRSSLHRWISHKPTIRKKRQKKSIRQTIINCIDNVLRDNPCSTMKQLCDIIRHTCRDVHQSSVNTVGRWVKDIGYTRKKVRSIIEYSPPKDLTDLFCNKYNNIQDDQIVSIDEAGFYVGSHGRYGYSKRGTRLQLAASRTIRRSRFTLVMAVGSTGIIHYQILDGSCKKNDFVQFIKDLGQFDISGKTLVMDNLRCHHSKETLVEIQTLGCRALYIPPYSPRFNAIEYVFSSVKRNYRQCCNEFIKHATSANAQEYVDILQYCLAICGGFEPYFNHVRTSVNIYFETGKFLRYD